MLSDVMRATEILRGGGVVVIPTETFYGLSACVTCPEAILRIVAIKGRDPHKPMPLIAADLAQVHSIALLGPSEERLAQHFWPGPLTLVLRARPGVSPELVAADGTLGIRVTSHPMARALALSCGEPLVATSANFSGVSAVSEMKDLDPALVQAVDGVLDGGSLPGGLPSTLIQVCGETLRVIREGAITRETIIKVFAGG